MKSMESRLVNLEKRAGSADAAVTWIVELVSPGPHGPVHDEPVGYATSHRGDGVSWVRQPGEMLIHLQERAGREVSRNQHGAAVLIECYAEQ